MVLQVGVPGPAAPAALGDLLEMRILRGSPKPTDPEMWVLGPGYLFSRGGPNACSCLGDVTAGHEDFPEHLVCPYKSAACDEDTGDYVAPVLRELTVWLACSHLHTWFCH